MNRNFLQRLSIRVLVTALTTGPLSAKKKATKIEYLRPIPTEFQSVTMRAFAATDPNVYDPGIDIVEGRLRVGMTVHASVLLLPGYKGVAVLLNVQNWKQDQSIEVFPQKVFLIDANGRPHLSTPEYAAKSAIAAEHRLPRLSPPPPETYYTITSIPVATHPAGPMEVYAIQDIGTGYLLYGAQPQITTYENVATAHENDSRLIGYEIGYLLGAWLNKRDAKKQIKWVDETWFHHKKVAPNDLESGFLFFEDVDAAFADSSTVRIHNESVKTKAQQAGSFEQASSEKSDAEKWVDEVLAQKELQPAQTPTSIEVVPPNPSVNVGATRQFTATGSFADASKRDLTSSVVWTSGFSQVATISADGLASGLAAGTTTIRADFGEANGTTFLTVTPPIGAVRLVIFIDDQQFVFWFGPEVVQREFK
jgi:hypothetical protein